jgi:hypothetical protein
MRGLVLLVSKSCISHKLLLWLIRGLDKTTIECIERNLRTVDKRTPVADVKTLAPSEVEQYERAQVLIGMESHQQTLVPPSPDVPRPIFLSPCMLYCRKKGRLRK